MKKALMLCALLLGLATTGCAWWKGDAAKNEEYNQLAAQAENEIKLADKTGFLWRDTEKFMEQSKAAKAAADKARQSGDSAAAKKEFDQAMKLAKEALTQAKLAEQQAKDQANPVIRY